MPKEEIVQIFMKRNAERAAVNYLINWANSLKREEQDNTSKLIQALSIFKINTLQEKLKMLISLCGTDIVNSIDYTEEIPPEEYSLY
jgi:hypothetical protein